MFSSNNIKQFYYFPYIFLFELLNRVSRMHHDEISDFYINHLDVYIFFYAIKTHRRMVSFFIDRNYFTGNS